MEIKLIELLLAEESFKTFALIMAAIVIGFTVMGFIAAMLVKTLKHLRYIKSMFEQSKHSVDYGAQITLEHEISERVRKIRHDLCSSRVLILQYHNGEKSIGNVPFLKLTCTHESLSPLARSVQLDISGLTANLFGYWNQVLFQGAPVIVSDFEEQTCPKRPALSEDPEMRGLYQFLNARGSKSIYLFPLFDNQGHTYAVGVVEYTEKKHTLDEEWIRWTKLQFSVVGGLLASLALKKQGDVAK